MKAVFALTIGALLALGSGSAWSQSINIATLQPGSLMNATSAALAQLLNDHEGMVARIQPFSSSMSVIQMVDRNEVAFSTNSILDVYDAYLGRNAFSQGALENIRIVTPIFPLLLAPLVPHDSPIDSVDDLRGLRLPGGYPGQLAVIDLQAAILANGGLTDDDLRIFAVPTNHKGTEALGDGKVDAAIIAPGVTAVAEADVKLRQQGGVRFVSIDPAPEAVARMQAIAPLYPYLLKKNDVTAGLHGDVWFAASDSLLLTNAETPDDVVYAAIKTFHENWEQIAKAAPAVRLFDPEALYTEGPVPYHPGAIHYLKEIGQYPG